MFSKGSLFFRVFSPVGRIPAPLACTQVRGAKQKFGGATRDPFKSLQRKLVRQQQEKHAKVPLISDERTQQLQQSIAPITADSLGQLVTTYTPLERFAKAPLYTRLGLGQRWKAFTEAIGTMYATAVIRRRLRKVDPFRPVEFARRAQQQFIDTNAALQRKDKHTLRQLVTENAGETLKSEFEHRRFVWELKGEIERPRVVNAKVVPMNSKENYFTQVVVRLHSSQVMAVFDGAGRLLRGHTSKEKPVIDYVVMERHLVHPEWGHGWRIAGKLPPQIPWRSRLPSGQSDKQPSLPAA